MYSGQATWFSNNGSYLAFATFNDTAVESYSYYYYEDKSDPDDLYPELVDLKYPKVSSCIQSIFKVIRLYVDTNSKPKFGPRYTYAILLKQFSQKK